MYICAMKSKLKLLAYLSKNGATTADTLTQKLGFSRQYIHKLLDALLQENKVVKTGKPPLVFYTINEKQSAALQTEIIVPTDEQFLNEHFLQVTPLGEMLGGLAAMQYWCDAQQLTVAKTTKEYIAARTKYLNYYNEQHLIDGMPKLAATKNIGHIGVHQLFYLDFYAIERFGKTRLGTLMHYAKQGQNKALMKQIVGEVKNRLQHIIATEKIDAILYVPPTIQRKLQIMQYLEKNLNIELPTISIKKVNNPIIIPQKALSKLFERVANANKTFYIPTPQPTYNHILIIDDAVGSGATINEIGLKLKERKLATKITALAITGSYEGFEVISEL
jgi:hypothetical protein